MQKIDLQKKPKKKKNNKKLLKKKLDEIFSLYIRKRDNYTCFICGKIGYDNDGDMQCSHLFSRNSLNTRWNEKNATCMCKSCHFKHHSNDSEIYRRKYVIIFSEHQLDEIYFRWNKSSFVKITNEFYESNIEYFKNKLHNLVLNHIRGL